MWSTSPPAPLGVSTLADARDALCMIEAAEKAIEGAATPIAYD